MSMPVLLLDIDGVISVDPAGRSDRDFELVLPAQDAYVPRGMRERLSRLQGSFACVWCSGWERDATRLLAPGLGIGSDWDFVRFAMGGSRHLTWKLPQVRRWCAERADGLRVAWVDDEFFGDAERWASARPGTLLVRTWAWEGLTEAQTEDLLEWARG